MQAFWKRWTLGTGDGQPTLALEADATEHLWLASRRITGALVTAIFPILFLLDRILTVGLSPVLPGIALLILLIIALPYAIMEISLRRFQNLPVEDRSRHARRMSRQGRTGWSVAIAWFVIWILLVL